jgi:hypothetical protein
MRINDRQLFCKPVVFSHPDGVGRGQARYLVGSAVAGREAVDVRLRDPALALEGGQVQRGQQRFPDPELGERHQALNEK